LGSVHLSILIDRKLIDRKRAGVLATRDLNKNRCAGQTGAPVFLYISAVAGAGSRQILFPTRSDKTASRAFTEATLICALSVIVVTRTRLGAQKRNLVLVPGPSLTAAFPRMTTGLATPSRRSRRECRPRPAPAPPPRRSPARPRRRRPAPRNRGCALHPSPWP
jgi:hypothetical protein